MHARQLFFALAVDSETCSLVRKVPQHLTWQQNSHADNDSRKSLTYFALIRSTLIYSEINNRVRVRLCACVFLHVLCLSVCVCLQIRPHNYVCVRSNVVCFETQVMHGTEYRMKVSQYQTIFVSFFFPCCTYRGLQCGVYPNSSRLSDLQQNYPTLIIRPFTFCLRCINWHCLNIARLRKALDDVTGTGRCPFLTPVEGEHSPPTAARECVFTYSYITAMLFRSRRRDAGESLWATVNERVDVSDERRRHNWPRDSCDESVRIYPTLLSYLHAWCDCIQYAFICVDAHTVAPMQSYMFNAHMPSTCKRENTLSYSYTRMQ